MQVRKKQLELDMEQQTASKQEKVFCVKLTLCGRCGNVAQVPLQSLGFTQPDGSAIADCLQS